MPQKREVANIPEATPNSERSTDPMMAEKLGVLKRAIPKPSVPVAARTCQMDVETVKAASCTIPPAGTSIVNTASSSQLVGASVQLVSSNPVSLIVGGAAVAVPSLTKSFASASILAGTSTPLVFRLTNSSGNPAQSGVAFTDTLPAGIAATSVTDGGVITPTTVTWNLTDLAAGATRSVSVIATVTDITKRPFKNIAELSEDGADEYDAVNPDLPGADIEDADSTPNTITGDDNGGGGDDGYGTFENPTNDIDDIAAAALEESERRRLEASISRWDIGRPMTPTPTNPTSFLPCIPISVDSVISVVHAAARHPRRMKQARPSGRRGKPSSGRCRAASRRAPSFSK